jgi:hypothetical protein
MLQLACKYMNYQILHILLSECEMKSIRHMEKCRYAIMEEVQGVWQVTNFLTCFVDIHWGTDFNEWKCKLKIIQFFYGQKQFPHMFVHC